MPGFPVFVLPDPDPTDHHSMQAWVEASVDGVQLRLLLDSGTPLSALPSVEPFASRTKRTVSGGRGIFGASAEQTLVEISEMVVGDLVTRELAVQLQPAGWQHPGLLGMDVLGSHRCAFFLRRGRLEVDLPVSSDTQRFPFAHSSGSTPRVAVDWATTSSSAVWDTGAGATLIDRTWAEHHPELVTIGSQTGVGTDVAGAGFGHSWGRLAGCEIGGVSFSEQICAVVDFSDLNSTLDAPVEVVLGLPLISQADWFMDFPAHLWAVAR